MSGLFGQILPIHLYILHISMLSWAIHICKGSFRPSTLTPPPPLNFWPPLLAYIHIFIYNKPSTLIIQIRILEKQGNMRIITVPVCKLLLFVCLSTYFYYSYYSLTAMLKTSYNDQLRYICLES